MGKTRYGKDASACESTYDLKTEKWISVVRFSISKGYVEEGFVPFDSKGEADAHAAEVARSLNDPGLLKHGGRAYKEAMARRDKVLARHESLGRVPDGSVRCACLAHRTRPTSPPR